MESMTACFCRDRETSRLLLDAVHHIDGATWGNKDGKPTRLMPGIGPVSKTNIDKRRARFSLGQSRAGSLHELR